MLKKRTAKGSKVQIISKGSKNYLAFGKFLGWDKGNRAKVEIEGKTACFSAESIENVSNIHIPTEYDAIVAYCYLQLFVDRRSVRRALVQKNDKGECLFAEVSLSERAKLVSLAYTKLKIFDPKGYFKERRGESEIFTAMVENYCGRYHPLECIKDFDIIPVTKATKIKKNNPKLKRNVVFIALPQFVLGEPLAEDYVLVFLRDTDNLIFFDNSSPYLENFIRERFEIIKDIRTQAVTKEFTAEEEAFLCWCHDFLYGTNFAKRNERSYTLSAEVSPEEVRIVLNRVKCICGTTYTKFGLCNDAEKNFKEKFKKELDNRDENFFVSLFLLSYIKNYKISVAKYEPLSFLRHELALAVGYKGSRWFITSNHCGAANFEHIAFNIFHKAYFNKNVFEVLEDKAELDNDKKIIYLVRAWEQATHVPNPSSLTYESRDGTIVMEEGGYFSVLQRFNEVLKALKIEEDEFFSFCLNYEDTLAFVKSKLVKKEYEIPVLVETKVSVKAFSEKEAKTIANNIVAEKVAKFFN